MGEITVRRTHDPALIERILLQDAFDEPIPDLPRPLLRHAVRVLLAVSPDVYFIVSETAGRYGGFVLGHTLGPGMWRRFARDEFRSAPFAIGSVVLRLKVLRPLRRRLARLVAARPNVAPARAEPGELEPGVMRLDRPFAWSVGRPGTGQVDQLFVHADCRGLGLAPQMLECLATEMSQGHVTLIEAHVDASNQASLRAFLKAGWQAYRTTGGDFYVCRPLRGDVSRP